MHYLEKFRRYYNIGEQDIVICAFGDGLASDIHHINFRSHGGKDEINNLIPLCRNCHDRAHLKKKPYLTKEELCKQLSQSMAEFHQRKTLNK